MNVLNLNLPRCHFHTLIELVNSGHTVYSNWSIANEYESSLGIIPLTEEENRKIDTLGVYSPEGSDDINVLISPTKKINTLSFIEGLIDKYNIDILQVCIPNLSYLHNYFKDKVNIHLYK